MNILSASPAQKFLDDQVPFLYRSLLTTTLKKAYNDANLLLSHDPLFQVQSALQNRGRVFSWAVDKAVEDLIVSGRWPLCTCRWVNYAQPTGQYLEICFSHSTCSLHLVNEHHQHPRHAVYRENKRLDNQLSFDFCKENKEISGLPHFYLTYGHQPLTFAHFVMPASEKNRCIYKTENLMHIPHEIPSEIAPIEVTPFESTMTLKEKFEKWQKENE